ncbi:hypothetical protein D1AOALGA4SA_4756 [Olavius algarvensis Delta 1 endosymbiont]|nr:hypothetical protein D1AOALGA4SA_4756 [Olavius algarvensis Delta 1 endosymbiont]
MDWLLIMQSVCGIDGGTISILVHANPLSGMQYTSLFPRRHHRAGDAEDDQRF